MSKFAIITPYNNNYGGGEVYINELCIYLKEKEGLEIKIYSSDNKIFKYSNKIRKINNYKLLIKNLPHLVKQLKNDNIDTIIINDSYLAQVSIVFRLLGFKVYNLIHLELNNVRIENDFFKNIIIYFRKIFISLGCIKIFSVNKTNLNYFPSRKTIYVGNFINKNNFEIDRNITKKEFDFVYCGRFTSIKNIDVIINYFNIYLKNINKEAKLLLIGDGEERDNIDKQIKELGISNNIILTGFLKREEIIEYYLKSKVLLLFSSSEGFPTVILEALYCGVPCLGTNVGSISDILNDNNGSVIYDLKNEEYIIHKMNYLNNNYNNLNNQCISSIEKFTIEKVVTKIIDNMH